MPSDSPVVYLGQSVRAIRTVRRMRGASQAHLIECEDSKFYVTKFLNNPQHRRILINEWISAAFLRYLDISAPETAAVEISDEFLAENPETRIQIGTRRIAVEPGCHFGSAFPGHPGQVAVYDFLPDLLIEKVVNLAQFLAVFVFDKWIGNTDLRQAIFCRTAPNGNSKSAGFTVRMVDHGNAFDGQHWRLTDAPRHGLYSRPIVYKSVRGLNDFEPWLARVQSFPERIIQDVLRTVPVVWLQQDFDKLESLMDRLIARRGRVPDLIMESLRALPL